MALLALSISISFLVIQYYMDGKRLDFFNPKTLFQFYYIIQLNLILFLGVNFDIPGFVNISTRTSFETTAVLSFLFILGHVFFLIGYYAVKNQHIPKIIIGSSEWNGKLSTILCFLLYILGYGFFIALLQKNGGYTNFIESREAWRAGGMSGQGWLIFPATTMLAMTSIVYMLSRPQIFIGNKGIIRLIILISITIFPASQMAFRGAMLLPILQILFIYNLKIKKLNLSRLLIPLIFLMVIFTIYGVYREAKSFAGKDFDLNTLTEFATDNPEFLFSVFLRSKGADVVSVVMEKMGSLEDHVFLYPSIIEAITIFVPSALWSGKPEPLSVQFSQVFFGIGGGVSPTIVGEAYWHAGWFGVCAVLFAIGLFFKAYVNSIKKYHNNNSMLLFLTASFTSLIMFAEAVQGYLNGLVLTYIFSLFMAILFSLANQKRKFF